MGNSVVCENNKQASQNLTFNILEEKLQEEVGIVAVDLDVLKILNLCDKDGHFNISGQLLADDNQIESSAIDIVRFGDNTKQILYKETISNKSILFHYDRAIEIFEQYYQYEEINGDGSEIKELIPKQAFKEVLANAIVHRDWEIDAHIHILMYKDKIEINSPGGLAGSILEEEYLYRDLSVLRNPTIVNVFRSLNIITNTGTGIARINLKYKDSYSKPNYDFGQNNVNIMLPVLEADLNYLSEPESKIYFILKEELELSRLQIDEKTGFNKYKTIRTLNKLVDKGAIRKRGDGPGTRYRLK